MTNRTPATTVTLSAEVELTNVPNEEVEVAVFTDTGKRLKAETVSTGESQASETVSFQLKPDREEPLAFYRVQVRRMKDAAPQAADHLEAAAVLYDQVGDCVTPLWPWPIDPGAGAMQALADAHTRRALARHVRATRDKEAKAVDHLEQALAELV